MAKVPPLSLKEPSGYEQYPDIQTLLSSTQAKVLQEAALSIQEDTAPVDLMEVTDVGSMQLQALYNKSRYRVHLREQLRDMLSSELKALNTVREGTFPLLSDRLEPTDSIITFTDRHFQGSEFDCELLWDRRCKLEAELTQCRKKMDAEDLMTEQMSTLLHKTRELTESARKKTDQLRYLQKRLLKRHDEIITLHARADNEAIHASYSSLKATASSTEAHSKRLSQISTKTRQFDSLKEEISSLGESAARRIVTEQQMDRKIRTVAEQLSRLEAMHQEAKLQQNKHKNSLKRMNEALQALQR